MCAHVPHEYAYTFQPLIVTHYYKKKLLVYDTYMSVHHLLFESHTTKVKNVGCRFKIICICCRFVFPCL